MKDLALVDEKEIALIERVSGVFLKKGMKRVTMDDVAKELSVSKKTLYKYVKNRKELVMKSTYFHVQRDQSKVREIQAKNLNPIIENHELAKFVIETISNVSPCVHYDLENYFPESWKLLNGYFRGFVFESLHTNLIRGQREGVYRLDFNAEITFLTGDCNNRTISPIISSFDFIEDKSSNCSSPKYISLSIIAPFKIGLSDFFLKSLITFAGAFPTSDNITEVFPLRVSKRLTISFKGTALGPSDKASFGLGCVSINSPSTPTAIAAFAIVSIN